MAFLPALLLARGLTWRDRWLIAWFGPRGLSSVLLVLLPVFAGVPGTEQLLPVCCLVVLVSVVVHGLSPRVLLRGGSGSAEGLPTPERAASHLPGRSEPANVGGPVVSRGTEETHSLLENPEYLEIPELLALQRAGEPVVVVDGRSDRTYNDSELLAQGAVRLAPDRAIFEAEKLNLPRAAVLAVFCA